MKKYRLLFALITVLFASHLLDWQLKAQAPKIVISEAIMTNERRVYMELANMGDTALNLKHFKVGSLLSNSVAFSYQPAYQTFLPDYELLPGQTYVIGVINDEMDRLYDPNNLENTNYNRLMFTPVDWLPLIDLPIYRKESGLPGDSISVYEWLFRNFNGENGYYLEYHTGVDSVVIDVVKADIQPDQRLLKMPNDVAGVYQATKMHVLIRKSNITTGNTNWDISRGTSESDSEWIVIPYPKDHENPYQKYYTTLKHHGVSQINESTFRSNTLDIDYINNIITVPWGIYKDSLMFELILGKGLAWQYKMSTNPSDSLYLSARTNDSLVVYSVGEEVQKKSFKIIASPPAANVNHVIPKLSLTETGFIRYFSVTEDVPVMDSIVKVEYALRLDTLIKYLEIPSNASWEIVWKDGKILPDLKRGDVLKITANNGSVKEYYIAASEIPEPGKNSLLNSITWPDLPEYLLFGSEWAGKYTIPGFNSSIYSFILKVPFNYEGIPALTANPADKNATVSVQRALNLKGDLSERTTVFTVTAEDGSFSQYSVLFEKELLPGSLQPFYAEPLITQVTFRQYAQNNFFEVTNVGNQPMDLSGYMFFCSRDVISTPADGITVTAAEYTRRFKRIVPGYNYVSPETWTSKPGFLELDLDLDPILEPGESFVIGTLGAQQQPRAAYAAFCDLVFDATSIANVDLSLVEGFNARHFQYGLNRGDSIESAFFDHYNVNGMSKPIMIFKIMNDSILNGTKGVNDPNDFRLVEIIGDFSDQKWNINGTNIITVTNHSITRKPQYWKSDTVANYSFGISDELSQWVYIDQNILINEGYTAGQANEMLPRGLGVHQFDIITNYRSTVSSLEYIVDEGYESPLNIVGVNTNTTVSELLLKIIKAHPEQSLTVKSHVSGMKLEPDEFVSDLDSLIVISADTTNTTKYLLSVQEGGLDNNAVLSPIDGSGYTVTISGNTGIISGIEFETSLSSVLSKIIKPATATINIVDFENVPVSLFKFNSDTIKVNTKASHLIYFEVVAQDNITMIKYQLQINTDEAEALLFSDMYSIDQPTRMVSGIPSSTRVGTLYKYLKATQGATMKLYDKSGNERLAGNVAYDDKVEVISQNGTNRKMYYLRFQAEPAGTDAYVLSSVLTIDQLNHVINNVNQTLTTVELLGLLTPAPGATHIIVDAQGNEVNSGLVTSDYKVKVTSQTGTVIVNYSLQLITSNENKHILEGLNVYPNPTKGEIYIAGLRENCEIKVMNSMGITVKILKSTEVIGGRISLEDQPLGLYFISISLKGYESHILKVVKTQ
jgi:hypothetical protein